MSTILESLRKFNLEKANSQLQFGNPAFQKNPDRIYFGNSLATSDVSRKYIEKFKAAESGASAGQGQSSSLLEALRKKNMDATTSNMDK